jgi:hypothetical protein
MLAADAVTRVADAAMRAFVACFTAGGWRGGGANRALALAEPTTGPRAARPTATHPASRPARERINPLQRCCIDYLLSCNGTYDQSLPAKHAARGGVARLDETRTAGSPVSIVRRAERGII